MDELKIVTNFSRNLIEKLVKKAVKNQLGYEVSVNLQELTAVVTGEKAKLHLNVNVEVDNAALKKILEDGIAGK